MVRSHSITSTFVRADIGAATTLGTTSPGTYLAIVELGTMWIAAPRLVRGLKMSRLARVRNLMTSYREEKATLTRTTVRNPGWMARVVRITAIVLATWIAAFLIEALIASIQNGLGLRLIFAGGERGQRILESLVLSILILPGIALGRGRFWKSLLAGSVTGAGAFLAFVGVVRIVAEGPKPLELFELFCWFQIVCVAATLVGAWTTTAGRRHFQGEQE